MKFSLISGAIEVSHDERQDVLKVGQQLVYCKNTTDIDIHTFETSYELGWKDNQLTFRLTPFAEVIAELEKWYNIRIEYNPALFKGETLTVRFEHYETLEHVLVVMAKVHEFTYSIKDKQVIIKNKKGGCR
jgi:ferric-dicitrate binding protein FerR (iron transport regulator)